MTPKFHLCVLCALCVLGVAGCSKRKPSEPATAAPSVPAASGAFASAGRVVGRVPAPAPGIPVIIVLDPKSERELLQADIPAMDQVSLTFVPSLLFVRTNQPAEFRNSDDTLHNVHVTHAETREPQFNVAIPTGESYRHTFKRDGFYHVGCDIHPAMAADVFASTSPYVTMADSDGGFTLEDVVPGAYAITVHAGTQRRQRDITVGDGTATILNDIW